MEIWQIYLVSYIVLLLCWLIINATSLLVSIFSKKNLLLGLVAVTSFIMILLGLAAGVGDLIFVIWLFQNNQIFWAVVLILIGFGAISFITQLLSYPFTMILAGFTVWCDALLGIDSKPSKNNKIKALKDNKETEQSRDADEYHDEEF